MTLESTRAPEKKADAKSAKADTKPTKKVETKGGGQNKTDPEKFKLYFNFTIPVKYAKPHQVRTPY